MGLVNSGPYGIPKDKVYSEIVITGSPLGYHGTNLVTNFPTPEVQTGTAITRVAGGNGGIGDVFVINEYGMYDIQIETGYSGGSSYFGITKNSTDLVTSVELLPILSRLCLVYNPYTGVMINTSCQRVLRPGDQIRVQTSINCNVAETIFRIAKVA